MVLGWTQQLLTGPALVPGACAWACTVYDLQGKELITPLQVLLACPHAPASSTQLVQRVQPGVACSPPRQQGKKEWGAEPLLPLSTSLPFESELAGYKMFVSEWLSASLNLSRGGGTRYTSIAFHEKYCQDALIEFRKPAQTSFVCVAAKLQQSSSQAHAH